MANRFLRRPGVVRLAYGAVLALFLWSIGQCYLPRRGFTFFVTCGSKLAERALPELKAIEHVIQPDSFGYDSQFYAQIAMHPRLTDRTIRRAVDNLPYRARRILFSWTAYALGGGDPARVLQVFALQNVVCWLALAWLLLRWFPPESWDNFVRWAGLLLSFGVCFSVRGALLDLPSLLLMAGGMALAEAGRPWWSAALLGFSGLGKETNVLGGAIFAPVNPGSGRDWRRAVLQGLVVLAPVALWLTVLAWWVDRGPNAGTRNFDWPFAGYARHWVDVIAQLRQPGWPALGLCAAVMMATLTVQALFLALRPRWRSAWWRLGAAHVLLMACLGDAVWEGFPSATTRVLLPMALAFNVLVPKGRWWMVVLLAGNLSFTTVHWTFPFPIQDSYRVEGPRALRETADDRDSVRVEFGPGWGPGQQSWLERWRWSGRDAATVTFENRSDRALRADVSFHLRTDDARTVLVSQAGRVLVRASLRPKQAQDFVVPDVVLPRGSLEWTVAAGPGEAPPANPVHWFSLRDLTVRLTAAGDAQ